MCKAISPSVVLSTNACLEPEQYLLFFFLHYLRMCVCIGVVLNRKLQWTNMIYTHGLDLLSGTPTIALREQVSHTTAAKSQSHRRG